MFSLAEKSTIAREEEITFYVLSTVVNYVAFLVLSNEKTDQM